VCSYQVIVHALPLRQPSMHSIVQRNVAGACRLLAPLLPLIFSPLTTIRRGMSNLLTHLIFASAHTAQQVGPSHCSCRDASCTTSAFPAKQCLYSPGPVLLRTRMLAIVHRYCRQAADRGISKRLPCRYSVPPCMTCLCCHGPQMCTAFTVMYNFVLWA